MLVLVKTDDKVDEIIPHIKEIKIKDEPYAYVCKNFTCGLPQK
ncbi:hypothetical protein PL321_18675 [Caloramator sp. mosi_1]|nr:hypothetical protein [Caloramator sp. mosi_1]WDC84222.1 hypothetical protein PL321_18675 [Caloramator sp. mosi_1]